MAIHSYPTVFALGHKAIADIFTGPVTLEEKIDGSQFSFGVIEGELECRSKGKQMFLEAPEKMFDKAIVSIRELAPALHPDWVYRCEYLVKPKHNALAYDRVPRHNLILYDIGTGLEQYMTTEEKKAEATRLDLECVPCFYRGTVDSFEMFQEFLQRVSVLGGCNIEGVVVKNYALFTLEKKVAMGKYVSEAFKEVASGEWKKSNPTSADFIGQVVDKYRAPARWNKAIQHLREAGTLEGSPRDIGNLIKEVPNDILKECEDEIKDVLFAHFWPSIRRGVVAGLPEWYKEELAKSAFEAPPNPELTESEITEA